MAPEGFFRWLCWRSATLPWGHLSWVGGWIGTISEQSSCRMLVWNYISLLSGSAQHWPIDCTVGKTGTFFISRDALCSQPAASLFVCFLALNVTRNFMCEGFGIIFPSPWKVSSMRVRSLFDLLLHPYLDLSFCICCVPAWDIVILNISWTEEWADKTGKHIQVFMFSQFYRQVI